MLDAVLFGPCVRWGVGPPSRSLARSFALMTGAASPFSHVVVHVVIRATSLDETGLEPSCEISEMNSKPSKSISVDETALNFGTVRPRVQIPGPRPNLPYLNRRTRKGRRTAPSARLGRSGRP
jgi:hypothetical protein